MSQISTDSGSLQKNSHIGAAGKSDFDYIILGAGCSGLSLVVRMIASGAFQDKQILIIEKSPQVDNDKTWCFWDTGNVESFWKDAGLIHKQWQQLWVKHPAENLLLDIAPYAYKMLRSQDFYRYCFSVIRSSANVRIHYGEVTGTDAEKGLVTTTAAQFSAPIIFSSVLLEVPALKPNELYLLQHFRGWWVETDYDAFDPEQADLMNFCTPQTHGCTFLYVLPVSRRRALIEYTLFSEEPLTDDAYSSGLSKFISEEMRLSDYRITEVEKGIIPMTDLHFPARKGKVFFLGTAGGQTKASSGYTFSFIQKQSEALVKSMMQNGVPDVYAQARRFDYYDSVLLNVLNERKQSGADVFYFLFKKNKTTTILRFLDNESNLLEELKIMYSTNKSIFLPKALKALVSR